MATSYGNTNKPHVFRSAGSLEITLPHKDGSEDAVPLTADDLVNIIVGGELALYDFMSFDQDDPTHANERLTEALQRAVARRAKPR